MATQTSTVVLDDVDGASGAEPYEFGIAGKWYTIDLTEDNANTYIGPLIELIEGKHARKVSTNGKADKPKVTRSTKDVSAIREWAKENGYEVNERGRISSAVQSAYNDAHA